MTDFIWGKRLGKGSFGEVWAVERKGLHSTIINSHYEDSDLSHLAADKRNYVIKQIDIAAMSTTERREALQEVSLNPRPSFSLSKVVLDGHHFNHHLSTLEPNPPKELNCKPSCVPF